MRRLCVFGASITSGLNDYENGGGCDLLKRYLIKKEIFVFNLGISGDDTSDLLKRIKDECKARNPDFIIIAIGGNDSQYLFEEKKFRIPLEETKENFNKIIEISKDFTSKIILIGLTKVNEDKINSDYMKNKKKIYKNEFLIKYDTVIKEIALQNHIKFIPAIDVIQEDDLNDGLHPTAQGHNKLFKRIKEQIEISDFFN